MDIQEIKKDVKHLQISKNAIIVALSIALGLAFGLGGQDAAARFIDKVRGDITHRD